MCVYIIEKQVFSFIHRHACARDISTILKAYCNLPKTNRPDVSAVVNFRFRFHRHSIRFFINMAHFEIVMRLWCVYYIRNNNGVYLRLYLWTLLSGTWILFERQTRSAKTPSLFPNNGRHSGRTFLKTSSTYKRRSAFVGN